MKKLILIAAFIAPTIFATAQSTTPRVGTGVKYDLRKLTYGYTAITDAAAADTSTIAPTKFNNVYRVVLVDSLQMASPTVTGLYAGDLVTFVISAASGTPKIKFATGGNWVSTGTATLSTGLRSVISFVFDGAKLVESSRVTQ